MDDLLALPVLRMVQPGVTLRRIGGLEAVVIEHALGAAAVALQGAQLLTWRPAGEPAPVIWLSPLSPFEPGVPIRGGVPICWPWFCDMGDGKGEGRPFHGFARIRTWRLADVEVGTDRVALTLTLADDAATRAIWDHGFALACRIEMAAAALTVRLTVDGDVATTAALHSYFHVGDIADIAIAGTGLAYADTVNGGQARLAGEPLRLTGEFGGIFSRPAAETRLADAALGRQVTVAHDGNSNIVVWNPWLEKSRASADIPDDGYRGMVCIETACVDGPLRARPGAPAVLAATYRVRSGAAPDRGALPEHHPAGRNRGETGEDS